MFEVLKVPMSFTWEIYGDESASYDDCFRMFNPLGKQHFDEVRRTCGRCGRSRGLQQQRAVCATLRTAASVPAGILGVSGFAQNCALRRRGCHDAGRD